MTIQTISMRLAPLACAAALLLAGCGGGGGGGDTPATAGFDASSYRTVAEPAAASLLATVGVAGALDGGLSTELPLGLDQAAARPDPIALLKRLGVQAAAAREQAKLLEPIDERCEGGGSITGSANVANANVPTAGDTISLTANNCVVDGVVVAGGLDITVRSYRETASSESGSLALNFRSFSAGGATVNGGATLSFSATANQTNVTLGFSNATIANAGSTVTLNYTTTLAATPIGTTVSVTGRLAMNGHEYTLSQPIPFGITSDIGLNPGGTLQIQEALGARVRLVAGTDRFTYQYFAASNSGATPDATSVGSMSY
ncbi:hypothetical protein [Azohydromonas aeria]|uniref:hypothetical protein n=1 Tax=Azohydromonas aeria TaxID=2590212 RepID=UPI0012FA8014|nr:hypothetical protein [Azohydromonas aeria]